VRELRLKTHWVGSGPTLKQGWQLGKKWHIEEIANIRTLITRYIRATVPNDNEVVNVSRSGMPFPVNRLPSAEIYAIKTGPKPSSASQAPTNIVTVEWCVAIRGMFEFGHGPED
jgi:hypothetical protein